MPDLPAAAITAAAEACPFMNRDALQRALEAAAPHLTAAAAAAERQRILIPDETLHEDGSIGPDSVPAEYSQDPAYWYRRWLFAMRALDEEAEARIAGWPKSIAAERARIRQLAQHHQAVCGGKSGDPDLLRPFADLLADTP